MTILAAVDGRHHPDEAVAVGQDLAAAYDDDLVVLHVVTDDEFDRIRGGSGTITPLSVSEVYADYLRERREARVPDYSIEDAEADAAAIARGVVRETLDGGYGNVTAQGRVGDPAEKIVTEAQRLDARYVVVRGRKRTPVGKAIFGSTSQAVLLDADQPVVVIMTDE